MRKGLSVGAAALLFVAVLGHYTVSVSGLRPAFFADSLLPGQTAYTWIDAAPLISPNDEVVEWLTKGTVVTVLAKEGSRFRVRTAANIEGYVADFFLREGTPSPAGVTTHSRATPQQTPLKSRPVRVNDEALTRQGQTGQFALNVDELMTPQETRETGVSSLTSQQREALNRWLTRYTILVLAAARSPKSQERPSIPPPRRVGSSCDPAVESTISGDFQGWDGETIFRLDNGQIWEQAEYDYTYDYQYRPDVTIYPTLAGCRMKVEDLEETILVRRIK